MGKAETDELTKVFVAYIQSEEKKPIILLYPELFDG
jgi:hypothetical protein